MNSTPTSIEREAIGLSICCEALSDLVNHSMLVFIPVTSEPGEMEVRFQTGVHRSLFLIRLLDFLSEKGSAALLGQKASCLDVLEQAASLRQLSPGHAGDDLAKAVSAMKDWLEATITPTFWLPMIDLDVRLTVTHHQLLRISGNQAKHNPSRLSAVSQEVQVLLAEHGHQVPIDMIPFVLGDLREHLSENHFIYYATWITELLNDIRWGIQTYLSLVYTRTYCSDPDIPFRYRFEPPAGIASGSTAHMWFHDLMNQVRAEPIIPRFRTSRFLRTQSSLEWTRSRDTESH
jgi:hypothetical protein